MCLSQPDLPKAQRPQLNAPPSKKKMELNPALTSSAAKKQKALGTRKLQIPLGTAGGGSGLNIG